MKENTKTPKSPEGVGPHEDRELGLMLAGTKPMAMFYDVIPASIDLPEPDFAPYVASGKFVRREEIYPSPDRGEPALRYVYYAPADEAHRIEHLHQLNFELIVTGRKSRPEDDILTGQLLGYEDWEIEAFIGWRKKFEN